MSIYRSSTRLAIAFTFYPEPQTEDNDSPSWYQRKITNGRDRESKPHETVENGGKYSWGITRSSTWLNSLPQGLPVVEAIDDPSAGLLIMYCAHNRQF